MAHEGEKLLNKIGGDNVKLQETWSECWDGFNDRLIALESSLQELIRYQQKTIKVLEKKLFQSPAQPQYAKEPMETDEEVRNNNENARINEVTESPAHFKWLKAEFSKRFQLSTELPKKLNIYSYDNVLIARGWKRVITTWQGMYSEIEEKDVAFRNLLSEERRDQHVHSTRGVRIFSPKSPDTRVVPRPHRFAVSPPLGFKEHCNPLVPGRFYAHVYQTKIETSKNVLLTLQSKWMAKELRRMCGDAYLPRPNDLEDKNDFQQPEQPQAYRGRNWSKTNKPISNQHIYRPAIPPQAYATEAPLNNFQRAPSNSQLAFKAQNQVSRGNNGRNLNLGQANTWAQVAASNQGRVNWPYPNYNQIAPQNNLYSWQPVQNLAHYPAPTTLPRSFQQVRRTEIPYQQP